MDAAKEPAKEPATDASSAPVQAASHQAAEAHRRMEQAEQFGKIVLTTGG